MTTELTTLERRTVTTELAELDRTALHTELEQPKRTALKKAASSLEFHPAHSSFREGNFSHLCGPRSLTIWAQGGVLKLELPLSQLDLDQLELGALTPWLKPASFSFMEKEASPPSLARALFGTEH